MNFGKLLGAGKSVMNGGKGAAYRADKRVYLPKFGSSKNPFANVSEPEAQSELPKPVSKNSMAGVNDSPLLKSPAVAVPAPVLARPVRTTTWVSKLNPAALFRSSPTLSDKTTVPVQAELSLEKVKVVHNDLTDAEVEVVPMKSRPARVVPVLDNVPAKKSWEILGEQIMKVTAL